MSPTDIILDGVREDRKESLYRDLQRLLDRFLGEEPLIKKIIVTDNFNSVVQSLLQGAPWQSVEPVYNAQHEYGHAVAKTIYHIENEELVFTIVLDGRLFENLQSIDITVLFGHEIIHVLDERYRCKKLGIQQFLAKPEYLCGNAWQIWMNYHAERVVNEVVESVAEELRGHGISVRPTFFLSLGHAETLKEFVEPLPTYIRENIRLFRLWRLAPAEISYKISSRVLEILMLSAYVYAVIDISPAAGEKVSQIEQFEGWRVFIGDGWSVILSAMREMCDQGKEYSLDLVDRIGDGIDRILRKCGLEMTNLDQGFLVNVRDV